MTTMTTTRRRDDLNTNTKYTEKLSKYKYLEMRSAGCGK
jgi:hypothetical protein